mgnify:CR=1 FL=1
MRGQKALPVAYVLCNSALKIFQIDSEIDCNLYGKRNCSKVFKNNQFYQSYCWILFKNDIFTCHKVVRPQLIGEVGKFQTTCCQISSGCCVPKIMKICRYLMKLLQKQKGWRFFWPHRVYSFLHPSSVATCNTVMRKKLI